MTRFWELRLQRGFNRKYTTAAMSLIEHDKRYAGGIVGFCGFLWCVLGLSFGQRFGWGGCI